MAFLLEFIMSNKQINYEAIGHCVYLQKEISQLIEERSNRYKEFIAICHSGQFPYTDPRNTKIIDLNSIDKPAKLLKKIHKINQTIITLATTHNQWADKADYEHYVISSDNSLGFSTSSDVIFKGIITCNKQSSIDADVVRNKP